MKVKIILILIVLITLSFSCDEKESNPTGPSEQNIGDLIGSWSGSTSQNLPITFIVTNDGLIDSLYVRFRLDLGLSTCTGYFWADEKVTINNRKFSAVLENSYSSFSVQINGNFSTDSDAAGGYNCSTHSGWIICGTSYISGSFGNILSPGTWEINKQDTTDKSSINYYDTKCE